MLKREDLRLYLCTDQLLAMGRPITQVVEQAIAGGVTMVQVREKDASTKDFYQAACAIATICKTAGIPLVVNDRIDIALAVGAQGVHLGQSDMPLPVARRLVGENMFIGISVSTLKEALEAQQNGADYLGVGAVYPTGSKKDVESVVGLEGLAEICGAVTIPAVAIGGVNKGNAAVIMKTGTAGVAVISAILSQPDIEVAARALGDALK